ncbi:MAG: hypothetical protein ACJ741_10305, partial [Pyrinomonadaceae bacterium]
PASTTSASTRRAPSSAPSNWPSMVYERRTTDEKHSVLYAAGGDVWAEKYSHEDAAELIRQAAK